MADNSVLWVLGGIIAVTLLVGIVMAPFVIRQKSTGTINTSPPAPTVAEPLSTLGTRPMLKIRVTLKGRFVGTHTFNKDVVTVGRDPASDIHLDNVNVAREHLRFEFGPSGYYKLVDLGSGKGTFLNDEQVTRGYVYNNDVVRIGQYTLSIGFEAARYNVG